MFGGYTQEQHRQAEERLEGMRTAAARERAAAEAKGRRLPARRLGGASLLAAPLHRELPFEKVAVEPAGLE